MVLPKNRVKHPIACTSEVSSRKAGHNSLTSDPSRHNVAQRNPATVRIIAEQNGCEMHLYFPRRIENITLKAHRPLQPLFEAIVNSIHATETVSMPEVVITIERDERQRYLDSKDLDTRRICNFKIQDNGVGFDECNFKSFNTSDTGFKPNAKGTGRFLWLKAFERVEIVSVFAQDGEYKERKFDFIVSENPIPDPVLRQTDNSKTGAIVRLVGFKEEYQRQCPKGIELIAERIIEHFLFYFLSETCPSITLKDKRETLVLNDLFNKKVRGRRTAKESFNVKGVDFTIANLRLYMSDEKMSKAYFCGDNRVVEEINLVTRIADLRTRLKDDENNPFVYAAYVSSPYLDTHLNQERTEFNIPPKSEGLEFPGELSFEDLQRGTLDTIKNHLKPYLKPITDDKLTRYKAYIHDDAPQYRPILKYKPESLEEIPPGLTGEKLDGYLYKINSDIHAEVKEAYRKILNKPDQEITDIEEYKENYKRLVEELNDVSKSQLAQYVIHRKLILDLLQKALTLGDGGKYPKEDRIHQMIYPRFTTSNEVPYEQQNLWIIDEKLVFHKYLASDKELRTNRELKTDSQKQPDIVVFGEESPPFGSVILIEFKRPMRDDLSGEDKDPIRQLYTYVQRISEGEVIDRAGRTIQTHSATRFYCYLICDITKPIKDHARYNRLMVAPDEMGYFGFHPDFNAYMEVIDYNKLVGDAKKRNRVLFERLDLPYHS
jgi:hypothetical protein